MEKMMTFVYAASYQTLGAMEAEADDPSTRDMDLEHFASPQISNIALLMSVTWVDKLCKEVENEALAEFEEKLPKFEWHLTHCVPEKAYLFENWVYTLSVAGEVVAKLVIQKRPLDE